METLINLTPDQLVGGETLILGGAPYPLLDIKWNIKRHKYILTYQRGKENVLLVCGPADQLTVLPGALPQ